MSVPNLPLISKTPQCTTVSRPISSNGSSLLSRSASSHLIAAHSFHNLNEAKIPSVYDVYPAPLHVDTTIPKRINVLRPPPSGIYSSVTETWENNWRNQARSLLMQKREHFRYHSSWKPYYYGAPPEKELHNKLIREGLKQQMGDKWKQEQEIFKTRVQESMEAAARDRRDTADDIEKERRRREVSKTYGLANKHKIEENERLSQANKLATLAEERELIRYNPINWSSTLK